MQVYVYARVDLIIPRSERAEQSEGEQSPVYTDSVLESHFESDYKAIRVQLCFLDPPTGFDTLCIGFLCVIMQVFPSFP